MNETGYNTVTLCLDILLPSILVVSGSLLNPIASCVFLQERLRRQSHSVYPLMLCISDGLFCLMTSLNLLTLTDSVNFDALTSSLVMYFLKCAATLSPWTIAAFTIERCFVVCFPFKRYRITVSLVRRLMLMILVIVATFNALITHFTPVVLDYQHNRTNANSDATDKIRRLIRICEYTASFAAPATIITMLNVCIFIRCWRASELRTVMKTGATPTSRLASPSVSSFSPMLRRLSSLNNGLSTGNLQSRLSTTSTSCGSPCITVEPQGSRTSLRPSILRQLPIIHDTSDEEDADSSSDDGNALTSSVSVTAPRRKMAADMSNMSVVFRSSSSTDPDNVESAEAMDSPGAARVITIIRRNTLAVPTPIGSSGSSGSYGGTSSGESLIQRCDARINANNRDTRSSEPALTELCKLIPRHRSVIAHVEQNRRKMSFLKKLHNVYSSYETANSLDNGNSVAGSLILTTLNQLRGRANKKTLWILFSLSSMYLVLNLPFYTLKLLDGNNRLGESTYTRLIQVANLLYIAQFCLHVMVYGFTDRIFRMEAKRIATSYRRCGRTKRTPLTTRKTTAFQRDKL